VKMAPRLLPIGGADAPNPALEVSLQELGPDARARIQSNLGGSGCL